MIHMTLMLDGQEIPIPALKWEGPPSYRSGDIVVNETGQALGVIMHSTDPAPRGHWELRDTPARWPNTRLDHIRWTSLNLGEVEYGR